MAWATALADLRSFINDSGNENLVKEQAVFGPTNGQNRAFFTFHDRLVAPAGIQSASDVTRLRIYFDAQEIAASGVNVTDTVRGQFEVTQVPSGNEVRASYYFQQNLDAELNQYLRFAAQQVSATTIDQVSEGLQLAALHYAAAQAYSRLSVRWHQRKSEQFLLQDQPQRQEAEQRIMFYREESARLMKAAQELRREFYEYRQDRGRAPAFKILSRVPNPYTPRR